VVAVSFDEWESMDELSRAQLLAVALRRDEPWIAAAPPPKPAQVEESYESYQLVFA
jgi:hypothetical protein